VAGAVCSTTGQFLTCSDERFKTNIAPMRDALDIVDALDAVRFDWRQAAFPEHQFTEKRDFGFIARELLDVVPEVVTLGRDGYYSVDYGRLTPILHPREPWQAVRHVQRLPNVSERRACRVLGQSRSVQRHTPVRRNNEDEPTSPITEVACVYGRCGTPRIAALHRREGWRVNRKRGVFHYSRWTPCSASFSGRAGFTAGGGPSPPARLGGDPHLGQQPGRRSRRARPEGSAGSVPR